jgi:gluconate 2-dehydrogenase gamma chain
VPTVDGSAPPPVASQPRTLSAEAFATLAAVCDRILPRDEDPGALDLGVPAYIDAMLGTEDLAVVQQMLGKVFPVLDKEAAKKFGGKRFVEIQPTEQDAILETWQNGTESRQKFFDVAISLTMEGAFGDPKYGGNVGGAGFKMIGFTPDAPLKKVGGMPPMAPMPSMSSMSPMPSAMHHDASSP